MERARERERERRLEARDAHGGKRSKLTRDRDRDIGEKIALGQVRVLGTRPDVHLQTASLLLQSCVDAGLFYAASRTGSTPPEPRSTPAFAVAAWSRNLQAEYGRSDVCYCMPCRAFVSHLQPAQFLFSSGFAVSAI